MRTQEEGAMSAITSTTGLSAKLLALFVMAAGHLIGWSLAATSMLYACGFPMRSMTLLYEALGQGMQVGQVRVDGLTIGLLSLGAWATVYVGGRAMMRPAGANRPVRVAKLARGTVLTETLIVIPVYLTVMLGSMQLATNAMAGLMTTLAAFQAGRTAAVWVPEAQVGRNGVDQAVALDKIRTAAAATVAPVVPVNFNTQCSEANASTTIEKMSAGLATAGHVNTPSASMMFMRASGMDRHLNVAAGFDSVAMSLRGSAKLRFAYCAIDVEDAAPDGSDNGYTVITQDGVQMVQTRITYYHQATMPIVAKFFGNFKTIGNRPAYYAAITRTYTTPMHAAPNPVDPF